MKTKIFSKVEQTKIAEYFSLGAPVELLSEVFEVSSPVMKRATLSLSRFAKPPQGLHLYRALYNYLIAIDTLGYYDQRLKHYLNTKILKAIGFPTETFLEIAECGPPPSPWYNLHRAIFGESQPFELHDKLELFMRNNCEVTCDHKIFSQRFRQQMYLELKQGDYAYPELTEANQQKFNEVLDTLTPREAEILRLRFGLNGHPIMTLDQIGEHYSVCRERIRQIEAKALRKLRHPSRSRSIRYLSQMSEKIYCLEIKLVDLERQLAQALSKTRTTHAGNAPADKPALEDLPIERLGLSVRALNVLRNLKITSVLQLCDMSERELIMSRYCGRKSFNEIREILGAFGYKLRQDT